MGYGLFTGGLGMHYGAERIGAMVIPVGPGNSRRQLWFMQTFGTTAVHILPNYALRLFLEAKEMGLDVKRELKVRLFFIGAEPHTEEMRAEIEKCWGVKAFNSYGLSEMCGPGVAFECPVQKGMHLWEDQYYLEIIDPVTGKPVPDGQEGELVLTTLNRQANPLLRYRTRDLTRIIPGKCPCGRTHRRIERITGRSDDMLIVNGVNLFPMQIEKTILRVPGVGNNYLIELDTEQYMDKLTVKVEIEKRAFRGSLEELERLQERIAAELRAEIGVSAAVRLVEPGGADDSSCKGAVRMKERLVVALCACWVVGGVCGAQDAAPQPVPVITGEQAPVAIPDVLSVPVKEAAPAAAPIPVEVKVVETPKKDAVAVSGYVRLRGLYFESDSENDPFTFRFDEWSLVLKKKLSEKAEVMVGVLLYGGSFFFLEHAYLDLKGMPLNAVLRLGASRNACFGMVPSYGNRKTTNYGIVSAMFTQDRVLGIQYLAKLSLFELNLGLFNGYEMGTRTAGEGPVRVSFLADRDLSFSSVMRNDMDENKEYALRIGAKPLGDRLDVGLSGSVSKLSNLDMTFLANTAKLIAPTEKDRTKIRSGMDFMVKPVKNVVLQGEYYAGVTSTFTASAWQLLAGYTFTKAEKPYVSVYARYGEVNPDRPADPTNSYTWKLSQLVLSSVWRFTPGAHLQLEYEMNGEKDGGTTATGSAVKVLNDVVFLELTFFY